MESSLSQKIFDFMSYNFSAFIACTFVSVLSIIAICCLINRRIRPFQPISAHPRDIVRNQLQEEERRRHLVVQTKELKLKKYLKLLNGASMIVTKKDILRGNDDIVGCNMNECDPNDIESNQFVAENALILPQYSNKRHLQISGKCSICLEDYEEGDTVIWSTNQSCLHAYHKKCIITWLCKAKDGSCPNCKQSFCENDYEIDTVIQ